MRELLSQADQEKLLVTQDLLNDGLRLRIDVGLSHSMPFAIRWVNYDKRIVVMGFEPHSKNFEALTKLRNSLPEKMQARVILFNYAIANVSQIESIEFFETGGENRRGDPGTSSLKRPKGSLESAVSSITMVRAAPLRLFLNHLNFPSIDMVKTDTQGSDLDVLKSLGKFIDRCLSVYSEFDSSSNYESANTGAELQDFMRSNGFERARKIFPRGESKSGPSDLIFVNKKVLNYKYVPFPLHIYLKNFIPLAKICVRFPTDFFIAGILGIIEIIRKLKFYLSRKCTKMILS